MTKRIVLLALAVVAIAAFAPSGTQPAGSAATAVHVYLSPT